MQSGTLFCVYAQLVCVLCALLRRVVKPTFIEERLDERDDRALVVGGQIRGAPKSGQQPGGARGGEIVADRREPQELIGGHAERAGEIGQHGPRRLGIISLVIGDDALTHAHGVAQGCLRKATPLPDLREAGAEAVKSVEEARVFSNPLHVALLGYILSYLLQGDGMSKTATVRARVEPTLKKQAEGVLGELGLNPTSAITMYYEQIVRRHAIPFDVSLPTKLTRDAIQDAETRRGLTRARNAAELLTALDSDD